MVALRSRVNLAPTQDDFGWNFLAVQARCGGVSARDVGQIPSPAPPCPRACGRSSSALELCAALSSLGSRPSAPGDAVQHELRCTPCAFAAPWPRCLFFFLSRLILSYPSSPSPLDRSPPFQRPPPPASTSLSPPQPSPVLRKPSAQRPPCVGTRGCEHGTRMFCSDLFCSVVWGRRAASTARREARGRLGARRLLGLSAIVPPAPALSASSPAHRSSPSTAECAAECGPRLRASPASRKHTPGPQPPRRSAAHLSRRPPRRHRRPPLSRAVERRRVEGLRGALAP